MMGQHRRERSEKRKIKELKKQHEFIQAQKAGNKRPEDVSEYQEMQKEASAAAQPGLDELNKQREGHLQQSVKEVSTDVPGLTDLQKRQLQESASNMINKDYQNYSRQLASRAGARGVRGGSADAQQMALQGQALDTRRQFERDLAEKDIDTQMQRLAAALASMEGKQAQALGAQSEAKDYLEALREKKRQNALANIYNKQYVER